MIKKFLSRFKDYAASFEVHRDACDCSIDITGNHRLSCIVQSYRSLLERGFDPTHAKLRMAPELKAAIFPHCNAVIIDGHCLSLLTDATMIATKLENGSWTGDMWIGMRQLGMGWRR